MVWVDIPIPKILQLCESNHENTIFKYFNLTNTKIFVLYKISAYTVENDNGTEGIYNLGHYIYSCYKQYTFF